MSAFSLYIIVIIIISIIQQGVKIAKKSSSYKPNSSGGGVTTISSGSSSVTFPSMQVEDRTASEKRQAPAPTSRPMSSAQAAVAAMKAADGNSVSDESSKSTTDLLREKARLDEIEHQKEKRLHDMEEKRRHAGLRYAQRLVLGDPIPKNARLVICNYCAAENLVPVGEYANKYNCYFCREKL